MIGRLQELMRANTIELHPLKYPCICIRTSTKMLLLVPATIARRMTKRLNTEKENRHSKRWNFTFSGPEKRCTGCVVKR
jgi:hypothetical protein